MKYDNQLRYAAKIIKEYEGPAPLSVWLKDFFKQNKQMGSRDRKTVSELVYGYYRLGQNNYDTPEERILTAVNILDNLPELKQYFNLSSVTVDHDKIFPWQFHLSEGIDAEQFAASFLQQPDLFIRIRPGFEKQVITKLNNAAIQFDQINANTISFSNATKLDGILNINKEALIQDLSSQLTGEFIKEITSPVSEVWDCCAASGGKSIMAWDYLKDIHLTVSDKRKIILDNLDERFMVAGVKNYVSFVADLTKDRTVLPEKPYDLIIADVPCSGSGTWSRTPEQLYFFQEERIEYYKNLQQTIISRVLPSVAKGGSFLYVTCSVFKEENEEQVNFITSASSLKLKKMELIKGYSKKADTMFAALFTA